MKGIPHARFIMGAIGVAIDAFIPCSLDLSARGWRSVIECTYGTPRANDLRHRSTEERETCGIVIRCPLAQLKARPHLSVLV